MRIKLQIVPRTADRKQNPRQEGSRDCKHVETETAGFSAASKERVVIESYPADAGRAVVPVV